MAEFYGRVQGNRGEATRMGSKDSGIYATAETWGSVLKVQQFTSQSEPSEHHGRFQLEGKYGGSCLTLSGDMDTIYAHSQEDEVAQALRECREAFDRADKAAQDAAHRDRVIRKLKDEGRTPKEIGGGRVGVIA